MCRWHFPVSVVSCAQIRVPLGSLNPKGERTDAPRYSEYIFIPQSLEIRCTILHSTQAETKRYSRQKQIQYMKLSRSQLRMRIKSMRLLKAKSLTEELKSRKQLTAIWDEYKNSPETLRDCFLIHCQLLKLWIIAGSIRKSRELSPIAKPFTCTLFQRRGYKNVSLLSIASLVGIQGDNPIESL